VAGLRLYQWLAVALLVVGAVVTTAARTPVPDRGLSFSGPVLGLAVGFGLLCTFAMGVDFPGSNRRFARLAPVEEQGLEG
jgi:Flp pilus assembly protein protease CpaA